MRTPCKTSRLFGVDAMRGLAILLVLGYHAGPLRFRLAEYQPSGVVALPHLSVGELLQLPVFHFGFVGVHAFFVVSGFCIHLRYAANQTRFSATDFFRRRLWRIVPPYWCALALSALLPRLLSSLAHHAEMPTWRDFFLHALFAHSFSKQAIFSINPAFWSLTTEMQFYLLYPLLLFTIRRFGIEKMIAATLILSLVWRATLLLLIPPDVDHFMVYRVWLHAWCLPRLFEWLLGAWAAERVVEEKPRRKAAAHWGLIVLLLTAAALCRTQMVIDKLFFDALVGVAFALVLRLFIANQDNFFARVLAPVGTISYSLYLVHVPIVDLLWLPLSLRLTMVAAVGVGFYWLCERRFSFRASI